MLIFQHNPCLQNVLVIVKNIVNLINFTLINLVWISYCFYLYLIAYFYIPEISGIYIDHYPYLLEIGNGKKQFIVWCQGLPGTDIFLNDVSCFGCCYVKLSVSPCLKQLKVLVDSV